MSLFERRLKGLAEERPAERTASASGGGAAKLGSEAAAALARVRDRMLQEADPALLAMRGPEARQKLREFLGGLVAREAPGLDIFSRNLVMDTLIEEIVGYGPLEPLMADPEVTDIMVNRPDQVYCARNGRIELAPVRFESAAQIRNLIDRICAPTGRRIDESWPMVDTRLPDGSRVNATIPPASPDSPTITIRKFGRRLTVEELVSLGALPAELVPWLDACVKGRLNIVVSGGTGSGKTTLLNCLSGFIPASERIVTIEDTLELQLQQPHVVRMEARPANVEGKGAITIRHLVVNALRMFPTRIIVGEVREAEAWDMLQAMNTGHSGSMTTVHCNSPRDAMLRLFACAQMAGSEIPEKVISGYLYSALDLVVHVARLPDGSRRVVEVAEVVDEGEVLPLWAWRDGVLRFLGREPGFAGRLAERGHPLPGGGAGG